MHGLIFKIKESHRQDQSESFVIFIYKTYILYILFSSQQVKWNHFIMTSVYFLLHIHIYTYVCILYSLFHRDETKPTHITEINSFLFLLQLIYKHSSPNYQHMTNYRELINKIFDMHKLKHFQPHSFLCRLWCILYCDEFVFMWNIYIWWLKKVDEAASTNFFFLHHIQFISHC